MKQIVTILLMLTATATFGKRTVSGVETERFDSVIDGRRTALYVLTNGKGMEACVTNYGARLVSLVFGGKDVVLGFDNVGDYRRMKQNYGATVGRYVGRINHSQFTLDGQTYQLQQNGKGVTSHGGYPGFADKVWTVVKKKRSMVKLRYVSADGENGFPGELTVTLTYRLTKDNRLTIDYEATTTKATVLNLTNHSFFNLSGHHDKEITNETMWIASDSIATFDSAKNLNGKFLNVDGTPFDFRTPRVIGERIDADDVQLKVTGGYDHSFAVDGKKGRAPVAWIEDSESGIRMTVYTKEPALHVYAGNGLKGNMKGKGGIAYPRRSAICFETMHFADSPNIPNFPSTTLRPGEVFRSRTEFEFKVSLNRTF